MDGYETVNNYDQDGQTIKKYTKNNNSDYKADCLSACNSNIGCGGMVIHDPYCWTIKAFTKPYYKNGSTTYKKIVYPTPAVSSNNFPTSANNNNIFSSVFCNNISTNNGFIQKDNSTFDNLQVYKTQTTPDENTCLNNCKNDSYCSSYTFKKNTSSSNCLLYNQVPTSVSNNDISSNVGYKNNYKYDFNNLNTSQKNVIRNDCINNYLNNNYNTNKLNYTGSYTLENNNSKINFNPQYLANLYTPLGKVHTKTNFTNIDSNLINSTTNQELNNFSNNYTRYLQTQIGELNSSNKNNINSYYNENINYIIDKEKEIATNNLLEKKSISTESIIQTINGDDNNENNENFENFENYITESKANNKSNIFKFYIFIFIVLIVLYIVYYLKKNK
jgi:hypothetical protein